MIGYDEPLSKPLSLSMERGQKIALVGANGIGKTTLLKSILGLIPAISGTCELGENLQIGYLNRKSKEIIEQPVLKKSGRNSLHSHNMKYVLLWQNADLQQNTLKARFAS